MTLHTDKDLNPKISGRKENLKSKPNKFRLKKGLLFWVTLIQAVVSKTLILSYNILFRYKIYIKY